MQNLSSLSEIALEFAKNGKTFEDLISRININPWSHTIPYTFCLFDSMDFFIYNITYLIGNNQLANITRFKLSDYIFDSPGVDRYAAEKSVCFVKVQDLINVIYQNNQECEYELDRIESDFKKNTPRKTLLDTFLDYANKNKTFDSFRQVINPDRWNHLICCEFSITTPIDVCIYNLCIIPLVLSLDINLNLNNYTSFGTNIRLTDFVFDLKQQDSCLFDTCETEIVNFRQATFK